MVAAGHLVVHGGVALCRAGADRRRGDRRVAPPDTVGAVAPAPASCRYRSAYKTSPDAAADRLFRYSLPHTQPEVASTFALPRRLTEEGIRRHDFHGLSYEFIASAAPHVIERITRRAG